MFASKVLSLNVLCSDYWLFFNGDSMIVVCILFSDWSVNGLKFLFYFRVTAGILTGN